MDDQLRYSIAKFEGTNLVPKKEGNVIYKNSKLVDIDYIILKGPEQEISP